MLFTLENYDPMEYGKQYIVFLSDECESRKPGIMACNNGKILLDDIGANEYFEIAVKNIVEYESDLPNSVKEAILFSSIEKETEGADGNVQVLESDVLDEDVQFIIKDDTVYVITEDEN